MYKKIMFWGKNGDTIEKLLKMFFFSRNVTAIYEYNYDILYGKDEY
ncbi:MAG: hypothetical protein RAO94_10705 [Candidatus Stygibacter australis]|nr:hypothetical protein [Candidatus Stygibacter australis]MDP8322808.1 hypothetical protein [Candidatus Stygibacter australis]